MIEPGLTLDALSGSWRIYQRARGHRFSTDDLVTAWYGARTRPSARRLLDLGTGIGSVAMMLAYRFPGAVVVGIEAQAESLALARRSVQLNGLAERVLLRHGDLRDPAALPPGAAFDLVTGTPPYFPPGRGRISPDPQKAHCRFELRGGVETYAAAAARALAPGGAFVLCFDARHPERVHAAAAGAALRVTRQREVVPRTGRPALFTLFVLEREADAAPQAAAVEPPLVVRGADGWRTHEMKALRAEMGMPPTD